MWQYHHSPSLPGYAKYGDIQETETEFNLGSAAASRKRVRETLQAVQGMRESIEEIVKGRNLYSFNTLM